MQELEYTESVLVDLLSEPTGESVRFNLFTCADKDAESSEAIIKGVAAGESRIC